MPQSGARRRGVGHRHGVDGTYRLRPRTGRPVTDNLADYLVAVNADVPQIDVHFIDKPDPEINALGCRGVGELAVTGAAAAIANAVYHATGKRMRDLPITPDKLLQ